jgi:ribosome-associated heat shock protein Hsp15
LLSKKKGCKVYQDTNNFNDASMTKERSTGLRIDRWLWYARFFKTRSLAAAAVTGGHVRINDQKARAGSRVHPGDHVQIRRHQLQYDVELLSIPARRGPASEAQSSYAESEESQRRRQEARDRIRADRSQMPMTDGKPDKHTRRKLRTRNRGQV